MYKNTILCIYEVKNNQWSTIFIRNDFQNHQRSTIFEFY